MTDYWRSATTEIVDEDPGQRAKLRAVCSTCRGEGRVTIPRPTRTRSVTMLHGVRRELPVYSKPTQQVKCKECLGSGRELPPLVQITPPSPSEYATIARSAILHIGGQEIDLVQIGELGDVVERAVNQPPAGTMCGDPSGHDRFIVGREGSWGKYDPEKDLSSRWESLDQDDEGGPYVIRKESLSPRQSIAVVSFAPAHGRWQGIAYPNTFSYHDTPTEATAAAEHVIRTSDDIPLDTDDPIVLARREASRLLVVHTELDRRWKVYPPDDVGPASRSVATMTAGPITGVVLCGEGFHWRFMGGGRTGESESLYGAMLDAQRALLVDARPEHGLLTKAEFDAFFELATKQDERMLPEVPPRYFAKALTPHYVDTRCAGCKHILVDLSDTGFSCLKKQSMVAPLGDKRCAKWMPSGYVLKEGQHECLRCDKSCPSGHLPDGRTYSEGYCGPRHPPRQPVLSWQTDCTGDHRMAGDGWRADAIAGLNIWVVKLGEQKIKGNECHSIREAQLQAEDALARAGVELPC